VSCVGDLLFTVGTCCCVTVMVDTGNRKLRICRYRSAILPQFPLKEKETTCKEVTDNSDIVVEKFEVGIEKK